VAPRPGKSLNDGSALLEDDLRRAPRPPNAQRSTRDVVAVGVATVGRVEMVRRGAADQVMVEVATELRRWPRPRTQASRRHWPAKLRMISQRVERPRASLAIVTIGRPPQRRALQV
jgi:hypothetical protein